ncbi:MAG TPA: hypothetical protein PLZ43_14230 [bacterium]|nr:hypothetical protein [bacterium]
MKYLRDYTETAQTELFNRTGAFFAFSTEQFNEKAKEGIKYANCGHGLICPKDKVDELIEGLESINKKGIELDLQENGKEKIIRRELANYETQISGEWKDVAKILKKYGITEEEVCKGYQVFYQECIDNNWF